MTNYYDDDLEKIHDIIQRKETEVTEQNNYLAINGMVSKEMLESITSKY